MSKEKLFIEIREGLVIHIDDIAECKSGIEKKIIKDDRGHGLIIEKEVEGDPWVSIVMRTTAKKHTLHGEIAVTIRKAIEDHRIA